VQKGFIKIAIWWFGLTCLYYPFAGPARAAGFAMLTLFIPLIFMTLFCRPSDSGNDSD